MHRYAHFLSNLVSHPWAMEPGALATLCSVVKRRILADSQTMAQGQSQASIVNDGWRNSQNHGGVAWFAEEFTAAIPGQTASAIARKAGRVAVLPVRGVMGYRLGTMEEFSGGTSTERLSQALTQLRGDSSVKAIVMDFDTPGGTTNGIMEIADAVYGARGDKPIIAQVNPMAASAGYWLATQADEVVLTPSGDVGSIGVLAIHEEISKFLSENGVTETIVRSSQYKAELNPYEPLTAEARAYMQQRVDEFDAHFHDAVARGRGASVRTVREDFGRGRMLGASAAVAAGMVDRVATMEQTLNRFGATMGGAAPRQRAQEARATIAARHALRRAQLKR